VSQFSFVCVPLFPNYFAHFTFFFNFQFAVSALNTTMFFSTEKANKRY